ncbi:PAS domain S-box protein [Balneola sp. EhC07]|jgi:PAS domain S-box-containing protein|uniref:PAS domain-containing sensor histidine kinase n=1 Tax=Balneola sp. EhC07 TaxID=1849360 RepID=UPI0007F3BA19|nr:PAS domain S-box protein [Balneola sp. EhC07]OAN60643.1 PAS domain S-box protein [Balneola sp. EhC07]
MTFFDSQLMFVCDQLNLKILDANEAVISKLQYSKKELIGKSLSTLGKNIDLSQEEFVDLGLPFIETWKIFSKSKDEFFVQFSSHLINYKGIPSKVVIAHDVTNVFKKKASSKKAVSLPIGFQDFPLAEIEWDLNHKILRWSKRAELLFGYSHSDVNKNPFLIEDLIKESDFNKITQANRDALEELSPTKILTLRTETKSGEYIECEWYNSYLFDNKGHITSIYSVIKDITEETLAREKSRQLMTSFMDLYNSITDAIYLLNPLGVIVDVNAGLTKTFGYEKEEVIGQQIKFLSASGKYDDDLITDYLKRAKDGESISYEGWGEKKNGEVFPTEVLMNSGSYLDEDVIIVVERDVSERLLSHQELKHRESMFSNLFHSSPIGIAQLDRHQEIESVNQSFEEIFGYTQKEVKGLELDKLIVPEDEYQDALELSTSEIAKVYSGKRRTKSGNIIDVIVCAVPVIVDGRIISMYGIYVDITERKRAEEKLKSNLREKEVLLAEIHHRVKNNLAVITGLLELQALNSENEDAHKVLKDSQMRVNSIALVHELLYQSDDFSQVDIPNYLKDLTRVISNSLERRAIPVNIEFDLDQIELEITQAIPCGLILNEILTNSYKHAFAGRKKGEIFISFKNFEDKIVYKVRDNGVGLPEENEEDKQSLGMTLVKTLGRQLNAETNIYSDNGASFEFRFEKKGNL